MLCSKCKEGYGLYCYREEKTQQFKQTCRKCSQNCQHCKFQGGKQICLQCKNYNRITNNNECVYDKKCEEQNCLSCKYGKIIEQKIKEYIKQIQTYTCFQCKYGFAVDANDHQCYQSTENCLEIQKEEPQKCLKCQQNYYINNQGKCLKIEQNIIDNPSYFQRASYNRELIKRWNKINQFNRVPISNQQLKRDNNALPKIQEKYREDQSKKEQAEISEINTQESTREGTPQLQERQQQEMEWEQRFMNAKPQIIKKQAQKKKEQYFVQPKTNTVYKVENGQLKKVNLIKREAQKDPQQEVSKVDNNEPIKKKNVFIRKVKLLPFMSKNQRILSFKSFAKNSLKWILLGIFICLLIILIALICAGKLKFNFSEKKDIEKKLENK